MLINRLIDHAFVGDVNVDKPTIKEALKETWDRVHIGSDSIFRITQVEWDEILTVD